METKKQYELKIIVSEIKKKVEIDASVLVNSRPTTYQRLEEIQKIMTFLKRTKYYSNRNTNFCIYTSENPKILIYQIISLYIPCNSFLNSGKLKKKSYRSLNKILSILSELHAMFYYDKTLTNMTFKEIKNDL